MRIIEFIAHLCRSRPPGRGRALREVLEGWGPCAIGHGEIQGRKGSVDGSMTFETKFDPLPTR